MGTGLPPLLLASASPRRLELLRQEGIACEVVAGHDAEPERWPGEECAAFARRAAQAKAMAVATRHPGRLTLGADTIVVLDGQVLGKPADASEARRMLQRLSGRTHLVYTGFVFAVANGRGGVQCHADVSASKVTFRELSTAQIEDYVASAEPLDKAGAYGIQGLGRKLVERWEGSYTNIVGLPLELVRALVAAQCKVAEGRATWEFDDLVAAYITAKEVCGQQ